MNNLTNDKENKQRHQQPHPNAKAPLIQTPSRPLIDYKGKIVYQTDFIEIAIICDELIKWVEKQPATLVPIAFDMEWPFNIRTGPGKTSVIQLCADPTVCYVFQIGKLTKLPAALMCLLYHSRVCLHGVNIKNDFRKLARDFPVVNADKLMNNHKDLGNWCNEICDTSGRWSLERLVMFICKLRIDKNDRVRMGRWDFQPLAKDQLLYAAIDVYISQVIYMDLMEREQAKAIRLKEFNEKHGIV